MNNLSSRQVLEKLDNNLNYLYWHCTNDDDTSVIQDSIEQVSYLEKIINGLIGETVELDKALKLMGKTNELSEKMAENRINKGSK